jgi:hypothetical protein
MLLSDAFAIECEWWQIKVRAHKVSVHERNDSKVASHSRKEHCREKWKSADIYINSFKSTSVDGWPHPEKFKDWTRQEIQIVMEVLALFPVWSEAEKYSFYRAVASVNKSKPASSEIRNKIIVLYDLFFKESNKASILIHESAHHLFQKISMDDMNEFATLSGWIVQVSKDRKVFELPPKKLIKPDSSINKEEDFTNHLETYYTSPIEYKNQYPKIYEFFQKRWPL